MIVGTFIVVGGTSMHLPKGKRMHMRSVSRVVQCMVDFVLLHSKYIAMYYLKEHDQTNIN